MTTARGTLRRWTDEERETLLREWQPGRNNSELADRIDRSLKAIRTQAAQMGLATPKRRQAPRGKTRLWTPLELEILRRDWLPGKNNGPLAARLGRSEHAVKCKAGWLGLTKPNGFWTMVSPG